MIRLLAALLLAFSLLSAKAVTYKAYVLMPVDEAAKEKSFLDFRTKLLKAIEAKDAAYLSSILAKNIAFSFGGEGDGDGPAGFRRMWNLNKHPERSKVWAELKAVVARGGKFNEDLTSFDAPYVSAAWPSAYDSFDYSAVVEKDAIVRERARLDAPVLQKVSYEILRVTSDWSNKPNAWSTVILPNGKKGHIQNRFLQSPVGYRARFEKVGKDWKMATFIAGD
ncbi:MAG: SH3 domain-containing protein [Bacteriovoracia bacterium]